MHDKRVGTYLVTTIIVGTPGGLSFRAHGSATQRAIQRRVQMQIAQTSKNANAVHVSNQGVVSEARLVMLQAYGELGAHILR